MSDLHTIVGLGVTAISCARYLAERNIPFAVVDSREHPPHLLEFKKTFPSVQIELGSLNSDLMEMAAKLVVSPGVSIHEPAIKRQLARGAEVFGDIELFAHAATAPVIAITGTNAKSTVTTLVGEMAKNAGLRTAVGGNLGIPALDLLTEENPELFVLELSSFQLETTYSLAPKVAAILNVTPDHMDRYETLQDYVLAKQRIFSHCQIAVCNRDDAATDPANKYSDRKLQFTLQQPEQQDEFGILNQNGKSFLAFGGESLLPVSALPVLGRHYQANALAALAIGYGFGLPFEPMLKTLQEFKGLEHRCQLVRERNNVNWYNDSKGTNVGATLAAIEGLGADMTGKLVLIAGGVGKNADFSPLVPAVTEYVRSVILIGEVATVLAHLFSRKTDIKFASCMEDAVKLADEVALPGDSVLLSPACASFDMFKNYEHRGDVFVKAVKELA